MSDKYNKIKKIPIYFLFGGFQIEMGGVGFAVVNRANSLVEKGYDITLINTDLINNFDYVKNYFYKNNLLNAKINILNLYDYYSKKNTIGANIPTKRSDTDFEVKEHVNRDDSINYDYYDGDEIVKSESYVNNCLVYRKMGNEIEYFTTDGYNYLSKSGNKFFLKNRGEEVKEFKYSNIFLDYFLKEVCFDKSKPFIVCDSTAHWYDIRRISCDEAYKIGSMHGNPYIGTEENRKIKPNIRHFKYLDNLDALVLLTKEVKEDLLNDFNYSRFVQIPNFVSNEFLVDLHVSKNIDKIGIFSRISPEKQISHAIKAFKIVTEKKPSAMLEIYGSATSDAEKEEFEKLKKLVNDLNLKDNVHFNGFVSNVNEEMQKTLVSLIISQNEGLPLSLIESMASATPVIAYNFKYGPKDVITDGVDGIIVKSGDIDMLAQQILNFLDNPNLAIDMGVKAKEKIEKQYSLENVSKKWEDLFLEIYNKREGGTIFSKIKKIFF